jgi:transcriptional regulator with XRE-family HTH domain
MASDVAERVGMRMKERRDQLGLTQAQVAALVHTTHDQVSRWERGLHIPRDLEPIALALECDSSYFYAPEPDKRQTPRIFGGGRRSADDLAQRLAVIEEQIAAPAVVDDRLAAIEGTLAGVTELLRQARSEQDRISGLLERQTAVLERIERATEHAHGAADKLDEAVAQAAKALRSAPPKPKRSASKTAPKRSPRASR